MFGKYVGMFRSVSVRGLVRGAGCTLLALAGIGATHAAAVNFKVEGLPSGLQVAARAAFVTCEGATGAFQSSGGATLTEDSFTTFDRVTLPSGMEQFVVNVHRVYVGTVFISQPSNNGCTGTAFRNSFTHEIVVVAANSDGKLLARTVGTGGSTVTNNVATINQTVAAETSRIAKNFGAFTSLRLGVGHTVIVDYTDSAGSASISSPTIELTRQVNVNGLVINASVARAVLKPNNEVCVTSGTQTACDTRNTGTITAGALSVHSVVNRLGGERRTLEWGFTIDPSIGTGLFGLAARANDLDPDSYIVNGNFTELDLLPWKVLRIPVDLVN